jgi:hypothetical protein
VPLAIFGEYNLDVLDAILDDPRLSEGFRTMRLPQTRRSVAVGAPPPEDSEEDVPDPLVVVKVALTAACEALDRVWVEPITLTERHCGVAGHPFACAAHALGEDVYFLRNHRVVAHGGGADELAASDVGKASLKIPTTMNFSASVTLTLCPLRSLMVRFCPSSFSMVPRILTGGLAGASATAMGGYGGDKQSSDETHHWVLRGIGSDRYGPCSKSG